MVSFAVVSAAGSDLDDGLLYYSPSHFTGIKNEHEQREPDGSKAG